MDRTNSYELKIAVDVFVGKPPKFYMPGPPPQLQLSYTRRRSGGSDRQEPMFVKPRVPSACTSRGHQQPAAKTFILMGGLSRKNIRQWQQLCRHFILCFLTLDSFLENPRVLEPEEAWLPFYKKWHQVISIWLDGRLLTCSTRITDRSSVAWVNHLLPNPVFLSLVTVVLYLYGFL